MRKIKFIILGCIFIHACTSFPNKTDKDITGPFFAQEAPGEKAELFAPNIISSGAHEMNITISKDLKNIYIGRSSLNWSSSIVHYELKENKWAEPQIAFFAKGLRESYPFISPDNQRIYFNSFRDSNQESAIEGRQIWFTEFKNGRWEKEQPLLVDIDPSAHLTFPSVSNNGTIYFNSTLDGGFGRSDIYFIEKTENGYNKVQNLGSKINTAFYEFHPYISPDEQYIIFDAVREDGYGSNDLYISFKENNGEWSEAINMGPKVNTSSSDMRPYVSPDGKYLFFCSNRKYEQKDIDLDNMKYADFSKIINGPGNGSQDIYWIDAKIITELKSNILI